MLLASTALLLVTAACESALAPVISLVSPPSVQFRAVRGSSTLLTQTITVSNTGGGRLGPVTCPQAPASWLTCSVAQGNALTLTANPTGLAASPPPVVVPLEAPGVAEPTSVAVELIIQEPVITLNPNAIEFTATEGSSSATPSAVTVQLTNTGAGQLADFGALSCAPAQPSSRVQCTVNRDTGSLTVSVDPTGLAPGTYIYAVTVRSPNASVSQNLQVSLRVIPLPRIVLSQRTLFFQAIRGLTGTQTQTVTVTNSGEGSLGTVSCPPNPASWLTCSVSAGAAGASTVTFTANAAGLPSSPAAVNVNIAATGAANTPQAVTVGMAVEQPILQLGQNTVSFNAVETAGGGSVTVTPAFHVVTVSALTAGGTAVSPGTITCTPQGGLVTVSCTPGTNQVTLTVNPGFATPGTYVSTVNVSGSNSNVVRPLTVIVSVTPRPEIQLNPSTVTFTAPPGSTVPQTATVSVSNIGGGTLGTISCPLNPASWISCQVQDQELIITVFPSGLTDSPPPVTFDVTASNAPDEPKPLTVQLLIQQQMGLSANSASFTGSTTGTTSTPAAITIQVTNLSGGSVQSLGTIGCNPSLRVTCTVNQALGQVTISNVNPNGLQAGQTYQLPVSISASSASNSPQAVTVNLSVTP